MQSWNLLELETPEGSRSPIVLHSTEDARAVLIGLVARRTVIVPQSAAPSTPQSAAPSAAQPAPGSAS